MLQGALTLKVSVDSTMVRERKKTEEKPAGGVGLGHDLGGDLDAREDPWKEPVRAKSMWDEDVFISLKDYIVKHGEDSILDESEGDGGMECGSNVITEKGIP